MKRFIISLFTGLLLMGNVLPAFAKSDLSEATAAKKKAHYEQVLARHRAQIMKKKEQAQELLERREAHLAKKKILQQETAEQRAMQAKKKALSQESHQKPHKLVLAVFLKDIDGTTLTLQRGNRYFEVDASSAAVYQKQDGQRVRVRLEDLVTGSKLKVIVRKDLSTGVFSAITVWQIVPVANVAAATGASADAEVSGSPPGNSSATASGVTEVSGSGPGNVSSASSGVAEVSGSPPGN